MIEISLQKTLRANSGAMTLDVNLSQESGTVIAITGPSGSGKTTLLRLLAGLIDPEKGFIRINGSSWYDSSSKVNRPTQARSIGFVFQHYSLFPNMSVKGNLEYALNPGQSKADLEDIISIMGLEEYTDRSTDTLSGGQKQRVALARALVRKPDVLLLDEALAALDISMRMKLQDYIIDVHRQYGMSVFLVSHDTSEILRMANHVIELDQGSIKKQGEASAFFTSHKLSGKFRFTGHIVAINKEDVITVISVMVGGKLVKVVATDPENQELKAGDEVLLVSKAFNPLIIKV